MIKNVFIENFKAIHKGEYLPIQPFTVFIGNNGSGKSSVMEALNVLQVAVTDNLDDAFEDWGGLEKVRNYNAELKNIKTNDIKFEPFTIELTAIVNQKVYNYRVEINFDEVYVVNYEKLTCDNKPIFISEVKDSRDNVKVLIYDTNGKEQPFYYKHDANSLLLSFRGSPSYILRFEEFSQYIENWQFLSLNAHVMGLPDNQGKLNRKKRLRYDGRNIAENLLWLKEQGQEYLDNIVKKLQFVLPYMSNLEPHIVKGAINTQVELLLFESEHELPGWLLSSGTLRILALLSMFEAPNKPSVLFIDEIENGLDPRTIGLLLDQIESTFLDKTMQVIVTTHSPYFLDLVPLESIVVAEKDIDGSTYTIPSNKDSLNLWKDKFLPGKLYTMGNLTK